MAWRCTSLPQGVLLPRAPSCAHITAGSHASSLFRSPTFTCPWVAGACAVCFASGLGPKPCQLRWADDCIWPVLCVCALCARACIWVTRGIMFSSVLLLRTFAAVISGSLMTAIGPCACSCGIPIRRVLHLACCRFLIELMNFWTELFVASHQPLLAARTEFNFPSLPPASPGLAHPDLVHAIWLHCKQGCNSWQTSAMILQNIVVPHIQDWHKGASERPGSWGNSAAALVSWLRVTVASRTQTDKQGRARQHARTRVFPACTDSSSTCKKVAPDDIHVQPTSPCRNGSTLMVLAVLFEGSNLTPFCPEMIHLLPAHTTHERPKFWCLTTPAERARPMIIAVIPNSRWKKPKSLIWALPVGQSSQQVANSTRHHTKRRRILHQLAAVFMVVFEHVGQHPCALQIGHDELLFPP